MILRRSFLMASSTLALNAALTGAALLVPAQAYATCTTVSTDTTISNAATSCVTWTGGSISITGTGVLAGATTAITDSGSSVGALTNSGVIGGGGGYYGIVIGGSSGTISNSGTISGSGSAGIINGGSIGTISNSGTIRGINNSDIIETISNNATGVISGATFGISNYSTNTIGTISNSGTISGITVGIINFGGTIGTLTNSGLIEGPKAIYSTGTILSAISNSGTIAGMINVTQALTITGGSAGALGTLTGYNGSIGTITTNAHDLTFDSAAYQLLDDEINVGAANTVFNNGTLRVNTAHNITGNYTQGAGGTLVVGVTDASHYGQLIVSGAATMTGSSVLITPSAGALTTGEKFTIVQASGTGTNYTGVNATANGFALQSASLVTGGLDDLIITVGLPVENYTRTGQQAGGNAASLAPVLDRIESNIAAGGEASFAPILTALNNIGTQQGSAAEGAAMKQLAPNQIAPQLASSTLLVNQGAEVIAQHQQNFLSQDNGSASGRAAGSDYYRGAFWGQVSGGLANANEGASVGGYGQNSYGLTAGTDFDVSKSARLGLALAWLHANAWGTGGLSGSNLLTNSFQLTGYGSQRFGPAFVDGMLGLGYNRFDQSRAIGFLGSAANASYGGMQYMGRAEAGWDIPMDSRITFTPVAGLEATRMDNNAYTESGAGAADLSVGRQIIDSYATTLGFRAATAVPTIWGPLSPTVKLGWVHDLTSSAVSTTGTLDGVGFTTATPRLAPDGVRAGLTLDLQRSDALTLSAAYNLEARQGFLSNDGMLKAGWKF
jgi:outer membrane autotransporter protein